LNVEAVDDKEYAVVKVHSGTELLSYEKEFIPEIKLCE
jgi:hypothetical protein